MSIIECVELSSTIHHFHLIVEPLHLFVSGGLHRVVPSGFHIDRGGQS